MRSPAIDRIHARTFRADNGCLRFTGCHNSKGYGVISVNGERKLVHRVAYEDVFGPIPADMTIDHVAARGCRYKDCVETAHMEVVTRAENSRRQLRRGRRVRRNVRATHATRWVEEHERAAS